MIDRMKLLLVTLLLLLSLSNRCTLAAVITIPWTTKANNAPFEQAYAVVGDVVEFIWDQAEGPHNVFIHPTRTCNQTGRIAIGNISPVYYSFMEDDASPEGNTLMFACDVENHCEELGMRFRVTVYSTTLPPWAAPVAPIAPTQPTPAPVSPTEAPVAPTLDPTASITGEPTFFPTWSPTISPTATPVVPATLAPTAVPVIPPTSAPVVPETVAPTLVAVIPTEAPITPSPTATDTVLSPAPTPEQTAEGTATPTNMESAPSTPLVNQTLRGLEMQLFGISSFGESVQENWETVTEAFSAESVQKLFSSTVSSYQTIYNVTSSVLVVPPADGSGRRLSRRLQQPTQNSVMITYTQTMIYETNDDTVTPDLLAVLPFETEPLRMQYVDYMNKFSGDPVLEQVTETSQVTVAGPTMPPINIPPTNPPMIIDDEPILSTPAIIGIACGGGALLLLIAFYFLFCRKRNTKAVTSDPPLNVAVSTKDDEVSTLHDPTVPGHSAQHAQPGDQSVATVDYDYSKAYGNGDTSVSSAGGTFGSNTFNQSAFDPGNAAATGATLGPAFDDDESFEAHYRTPGANSKEEVLHVFAPPGKLGVVIDTPDDGAPIVHAVKDSSVIFGRVQVGDKLVAVDDEDVRTMTAVKVSKLISRKSANPSRKLTIVRTTLIE
mmetsp:Transcript_16482/g.28739  ORF Transcript_16482/g.28739 Transcript_16482/m.28739 type:complete len:663 (+) Transcript_16482:106-2094(+)